jgi:hypothetical protein
MSARKIFIIAVTSAMMNYGNAHAEADSGIANQWLYDHSQNESDEFTSCISSATNPFNNTKSSQHQVDKATELRCNEIKYKLREKLISSMKFNIHPDKREGLADQYIEKITKCVLVIDENYSFSGCPISKVAMEIIRK